MGDVPHSVAEERKPLSTFMLFFVAQLIICGVTHSRLLHTHTPPHTQVWPNATRRRKKKQNKNKTRMAHHLLVPAAAGGDRGRLGRGL